MANKEDYIGYGALQQRRAVKKMTITAWVSHTDDDDEEGYQYWLMNFPGQLLAVLLRITCYPGAVTIVMCRVFYSLDSKNTRVYDTLSVKTTCQQRGS